MPAPDRRHARQSGFSLVELMVGVVVSLLVVLAAASMAHFFMQQQRESTGVGSATANALSALEAMKYEAQQTGLGLSVGGNMPCTTLNFSRGSTVLSDADAFAPVGIATSASGTSSTVTFVYGTLLEAATPVFTRNDQTSTDTAMELVSYPPVSVGQSVLIAPPVGVVAPCTVRSVTAVTPPAGPTGYELGFEATGVHNQADFTDVVSYADNSQVFPIGQLRETVFSLQGTDLVMSRPFDAGAPSVVLAHDIVAFAAQYGNTDGVTQTLQGWQDASGTWATPTTQQISQVHAVRVGLVARATQRQKPGPDGTCNATSEQPTILGHSLGLTGDWQCYRYRSLSAVVPLRNMAAGTAI